VHLLKYGGKRRLVPAMAEAMAFSARTNPALQGVGALVPVALHPNRLRRRGYNQSEWLAEGMACDLGLPVGRWLVRTRDTRPQVGLSGAERLENVHGAFVGSPEAGGKRILLVDDVATTGATAKDAARALKAAGAISVGLLTFARDV
jgi:predicted amidophosphoribosyltransferase